MQLTLRAGEKVYLNGAVIKADRKVSIELLNDVTFLRETHVMTPDQTTTPLRQLYFTIQVLLMDPNCEAGPQAEQMVDRLLDVFENAEILTGLKQVRELLATRRRFEALKTIRRMFAPEAEILAPSPVAIVPPARIAMSA